MLTLMASDMGAADKILTNSEEALPAFDVALCRVQKIILDSLPAADKSDLVIQIFTI